jgi:hypothetical protein
MQTGGETGIFPGSSCNRPCRAGFFMAGISRNKFWIFLAEISGKGRIKKQSGPGKIPGFFSAGEILIKGKKNGIPKEISRIFFQPKIAKKDFACQKNAAPHKIYRIFPENPA